MEPKYNVLLCWSKERSKTVASAFHEWLPAVLPGIKPWMSNKDISKGHEWFPEIQGMLKNIRNCIICLTIENIRSPWIYYEAGAIATNGPEVLICPYLLGISPNMLADAGPLSHWQCTIATRDDTWKLIESLNTNALESKHDLVVIESNFQSCWPDLEAQLQSILKKDPKDVEKFIATDADQLAGINLSSEARTIILEVSRDEKRGRLYFNSTLRGTTFNANHKNLCPDQSPRTIAKWKTALDDLVKYKILEPRGYEYEVFALTTKGYKIADALEGKT